MLSQTKTHLTDIPFEGGKQNLYTLWRESITFPSDIPTPPVLVNVFVKP